jgi:ABC-type nitrate/sulfonate/bicarbonate transport system substrate-binding protein
VWSLLASSILFPVIACTTAPPAAAVPPTTPPAVPATTAPTVPPTTAPTVAPTTPPAATTAPASATAVPPTSAAAPAPTPAELTKISVSYPDGGAHLPLFIARDRGIFQKYGLDVDLRPLGGGPVATAALLGGDVQLVDITGSEIVNADAQGANIAVLATLTPTYPYVFEVTTDITTKEDLKGKTVAIRAVGDATDIATRIVLQREGLDPDTDVKLLAVQQEGARMAALESGQICCSVAQVSDRLELEKAGFHALFDLTTLGLPNSQGVIAARRDYIDANPKVIQGFMNALVESIAVMKADKTDALPVLKSQLQLNDDAIASATYDFFAGSVVPRVPQADPVQFADSIRLLGQQNPSVVGFDVSKYIDSSYIQQAVALGLDKAH